MSFPPEYRKFLAYELDLGDVAMVDFRDNVRFDFDRLFGDFRDGFTLFG